MRIATVVLASLLVSCGERIGEPPLRTASPDEARCASSAYAADPAVKVVAVYPISPVALALRDEKRLNAPSAPAVNLSKWRDRPPGERLLLCWYDGPIGTPRGGGPAPDRFVVVRGNDLDQLWVAGPRTSLPVTSDPP
jgi:hypothetical protein